MGTTFGILITGEDAEYAGNASQAVFAEIDRLEKALNRFDDGSDVAMVNRLKPGESVRVGIDVFECLKIAHRLCRETHGAFDVTVGSIACRNRENPENPGKSTDNDSCADQDDTGGTLNLVEIYDPKDECAPPAGKVFPCAYEIMYEGPGSDHEADRVRVDLGGIGKGYAIDQAVEILRDWEIANVMLHSGSSTVLALGCSGMDVEGRSSIRGWPMTIGGRWLSGSGSETVCIRDAAVSGSGTEVKGNHIIDPGTGRPARGHLAAWVSCQAAAEADALTTAFMIMSTDEVDRYCREHTELSALIVKRVKDGVEMCGYGEWSDRVGVGNQR